MKEAEFYNLTKEEAIKKLNSSELGLSEKESKIRLEKYGANKLEEIHKIFPIKIFFSQFKSFLIYILLLAILISLIIQHYLDASVILGIVILNAVLGFIQQYKAEKSILKLRNLLKPTVKVFRDGILTRISSEEIVLGDILILNEGEKISADCRILESENLEVNESILTGESLPILKISDKLKEKTILAERKNMLYSGTTIVKGSARALVISTGMSTEFGKIAKSLQEINLPQTPMQKKLNKFAKQISIFVIFLAILTFISGIMFGQDKIEMFLTAIALAISAIPEGLPAIITISLAFSSKALSEKNIIIRRLPAAETLGSVTVICTDKTGTITEEKMSVREIFCNNQNYIKQEASLFSKEKLINVEKEKEILQLLKTSVLCSNARFEKKEKEYVTLGDPTESALLISALDLEVNRKYLTEQEPRIKEFSFTSERKMMSILRQSERRKILYSKGAPSTIIHKCSSELINGNNEKLTNLRKEELRKQAEKLELKGYRVLAFASKIIKTKLIDEENLIFLGFIAMLDPPRKEVKHAIELCKSAGIQVKMITGDSPLTAKAIAEEIGITGELISGAQLENMSNEFLLNKIDRIGIFARIEPKQKLRIVEILMSKGEEVAITGDGVNDVLALKKADIGIAMGKRGSDVAREVSDMILIDDNFASIVKGIEQGRIVYDNTKKATKFLLGVNFSELFFITVTILLGLPLPLLPLQILWMNIITDSIPALALTKEKADEVMLRKPRKETNILNGMFWFSIIAGLIAFLSELFLFLYILDNSDIVRTRTIVLTSAILFELLFVFTCRSEKSLFKIRFLSNKFLVLGVLISLMLHIIAIYTPISILFKLVPLTLKDWGIAFLFAIPGLFLFELWKIIKKK